MTRSGSQVLAREKKGMVTRDLYEQGFAFVPRCMPELETRDLADRIGFRDDIVDVPAVQSLKPRAISRSTPNLYSGHFGRGVFPLHTDLAHWFRPPRFILLRCRRGNEHVRTHLMTWATALRELAPAVALRARFRPRRPIKGRVQLLPFFQLIEGVTACRWDSVFLRPDNAEAEALAQHVSRLTTGQHDANVVLSAPGDTLLIDNWRALHGRSAVPNYTGSRLIERVYLTDIRND